MTGPDFSTVDETFGTRFLAARKASGMSQESVVTALAERGYKLHVTAIGKIERGERRVTVGEAEALASAVGYTLDGIIGAGDLQTAYAVLEFARRNSDHAAGEYALALLKVAQEADELGKPLRDIDKRWLSEAMPVQTPARSLDARWYLHASVQRLEINPEGVWVKTLLDAVVRDSEALEAALPAKGSPRARSQRISRPPRSNDG